MTEPNWSNRTLWTGDNLDIMRGMNSESVDLIYLDPPFNSNRDYAAPIGSKAAGAAFKDTWSLSDVDEAWHGEIADQDPTLYAIVDAAGLSHGKGMKSYLIMMAVRLLEMRRIMKPTGSLYLHCDPTASHYLKMLLDAALGIDNFGNEISWRRTPFKGSSKSRARQFGKSHDVILFYRGGGVSTWNYPLLPYSDKYLQRFKHDDGDGRGSYRKTLLKTYSEETLKRRKEDNSLIPPNKEGAYPAYKQYLSESPGGTPIDDFWSDINALNPMAKERTGYPTQKTSLAAGTHHLSQLEPRRCGA